jgi:hypothetical protein
LLPGATAEALIALVKPVPMWLAKAAGLTGFQ